MKKLTTVPGALLLLIAFSTLTFAQNPQRGLPFLGTRTFCDASNLDRSKTPGGRSPKVIVSIRKDGFATVKTDIYGEGYNDTDTLFGKPYTFSGKLSAKWIVKRNFDTFLVVKSATTVSYAFGQDGFDMKMCETPPEEDNQAELTRAVPANQGSNPLPHTVAVQVALQGLTKISFQEFKSRDIARLYPFLKKFIEGTEEGMDNAGALKFPPQALVADIRDTFTHLNLLFLYVQGSWCGSRDYDDHGCPVYVWVDEGRGYRDVMAASSKIPLYLLKDGDKTSVIVCVAKTNIEWSFEGHTFQIKGRSTAKGIPACI